MFGLEKIASKIEIPPQGVDADLAIPAFREDPHLLAERIKGLHNPFVGSVSVAERYVNIKLNIDQVAPAVIREVCAKQEQYGWNTEGAGKTVVIEYSSPNIAKPMHMGHARNNAIGHALKNIYTANGYRVITANYIGDWGMSSAHIMLAYQKWGEAKKFEQDPIRHLLDLYVRIVQETQKNPSLLDEAKELFRKLAAGDRALNTLWERFREVSLENVKRVYALLDIDFDIWNGESFYEPFIEEMVQEALDKGVATHEAGGPVVVNLDRYKMPSYLLRKSDGASLYSARDLAVGRWRLHTYKPDLLLYVVGHEQELYLQQVFKTLGLLGYPEEKFVHVSYGVVTLEGKKISTRSGTVVFLEDGLKQAIEKAKGIPEVGIGAVVFNMLSQSRAHDIAFNWNAALNLQGNGAPYIQYGYVRVKSILEKSGGGFLKTKNYTLTTPSEHEIQLIKMMAYYKEVVRQACALNAPHLVATFLNTFVQEFNRFYATTPVLSGNDEARESRLALVEAVAHIIKNGLWLLGIRVPNKM